MEEDKFSSHHREVCNMSESLNSLKGPGLEGLVLESVYMVVYIYLVSGLKSTKPNRGLQKPTKSMTHEAESVPVIDYGTVYPSSSSTRAR